ncbi:ATP-binding cassette domain-containing protein [Photobacterium phosphoreum]|jgi:iron complex transport system ATP-binding protein|uniref:ATP-binding cassette domain-containing protein n=1 Tax=Photobacterium phosphoreum TaxID=659 RepID=A0AAW4ZJS5_PHOPO|nr:ABC transporter ATP-binding protein [Photobacterium phosphoreum]MCD9490134.1 ATP-binding cassette domain-containing protein [Photobacterium phosphoreum]MCF2189400.1 ATP-binding cassette domain-containing protein [Photobacterium phosphoreum]MCF2301262.1 ATP-binding cassette domain-containing protein [Photobacterium phosphoreum]
MVLLNIENVNYQLNKTPILQNINFKVSAGKSIALLGTNGAGKTTLLRLLLGLIQPNSGMIHLLGKPLTQWPRQVIAQNIAYVPQQHIPHFPFTARQIVEQGCLPKTGFFNSIGQQQQQYIEQVMQQMAITHLQSRTYNTLSGGERQRTLIARALVQQTPIILLDEPTNGLDYGSQIRLLLLLKTIAHEGKSIITITHSPEHTFLFADHVLAMKQGKIIASGSPQHIITPDLITELYNTQVDDINIGQARFFIPKKQY